MVLTASRGIEGNGLVQGADACCGTSHQFDTGNVAEEWWPERLKCLIVGESPGSPGSSYFYDSLPEDADLDRDPVEVRRYLLAGLSDAGLIAGRTLSAFRDAGLAFDHGIRCQLPSRIIEAEWRRALRFRSNRAHRAVHLKQGVRQAPRVWIMGHIARDAVRWVNELANVIEERPLDPPYVIETDRTPKLFVSRYLNHYAARQVHTIVAAFQKFVEAD
jgi:hypothetical protein